MSDGRMARFTGPSYYEDSSMNSLASPLPIDSNFNESLDQVGMASDGGVGKDDVSLSTCSGSGCGFDCLCRIISDTDAKDVDVDEIYQVLGRDDVLKSSLLDDIDLYLECDDDSMYVMPSKSSKLESEKHDKPVGQPLSVRFTVSAVNDTNTTDKNRFHCDICDASFTRENLVLNHKAKVHGIRNLFACKLCNYRGQLHAHLQKHMRRMHTEKSVDNDKPIAAINGLPKESVPNITLLGDGNSMSPPSKTLHPPTPYQCVNNIDFGATNITVPWSSSPMLSPVTRSPCSFDTNDWSPRNSCMFSQNQSQPFSSQIQPTSPHACQPPVVTPGVPFENQLDFYTCGVCQKQLKQKKSLEYHKRKHCGAFHFECQSCAKKFPTVSSLTAHAKTHDTTRNYRCNEVGCGRAFRRNTDLKAHVRVVHREKLYACSEDGCKKVYALEKDLRSHLVAHTDTHKCPWPRCGKTFRDHYNLKLHHQTHTKGSMNYKCQYCDYTCIQQAALQYHVKRQHNGQINQFVSSQMNTM